MPNHAKPSQTTHNHYWEHRNLLNQNLKKTLKKEEQEEDESSIKSRLNKRQALEATNKSILNVPLFKIQLHGDLKKKLKKHKHENMRIFFFTYTLPEEKCLLAKLLCYSSNTVTSCS